MKKLKSFSTIRLFLLALAFTACNENPKDNDSTSTIISGGNSNSDTAINKKDAAIITNDTLKTPGVEGGATNNNQDITK